MALISHLRNIGPWLAIGMLGVFGLIASLPPPPAHSTTLMAVFPPWWAPNQVWDAAGSVGYVVGVGGKTWAVVVHSDSTNLALKLRRVGAWLVLDPRGMGICTSQ